MKRKYPYLNDSEFLIEINNLKVKTRYAKITLLNWAEEPIEDIQGKVLNGSININGDSAMRRTCNISIYIEDAELDFQKANQIISINKKIYLEIGIKNTTNKYTQYPILWFPQGLFIIMDPSLSHSSSGITASLQLKDKMCLLNGECGGTFPAAVNFSEIETIDTKTGEVVITKPTIYQIIQEMVNHFGEEQLGKIIISDVDTRIKQVMKWTATSPLYIRTTMKSEDGSRQYDASLTDEFANTGNESVLINSYDSRMDVGYIYTDFVYPKELIGEAGQNVCNILDEIKNTLGNYEYFYDVDGNFIFQEKKNYLNTTQATIDIKNLQTSNYIIDMTKGKKVYNFNDNLITSFSNSPRFSNVKNDFIVWGIRKTLSGAEIPIRYHLAIDKKPKTGNSYNVVFYEDESGTPKAKIVDSKNDNVEVKTIISNDWRSELYLQGLSADIRGVSSNYYYTELDNEWLKLYDMENTVNPDFFKDVRERPYEIDFFLDFIDSRGPLGQFSVENIGRRSKVISDNSINCLFEPEIPNLVFIESGKEDTAKLRQECERKNQDYVQVSSEIYKYLELGGTFNSAYNLIKDLLYQYTNYNETVNIQSIPIYYLEPNTRIGITDTKIGIQGDYIINSISLSLDVGGSMSISATRALDKI